MTKLTKELLNYIGKNETDISPEDILKMQFQLVLIMIMDVPLQEFLNLHQKIV